MTKKKAKLKLFFAFISLFSASVLLILSSIVLFRPNSLAWFASNMNLSANGMQVNVDKLDITMTYYRKGPSDADYVQIQSFESIFDGLFPGDTVSLKVTYDSKEAEEHNVTVYLSGFDGCEVPIVIDERYYYFGSQLKIVETDEFLLTPPADFVSYDAEQECAAKTVGTVTIPAKSTADFEFSIQFVNRADTDQNAYQGFGSLGLGERWYRNISSEFEDF